jgi:hypothetical protein
MPGGGLGSIALAEPTKRKDQDLDHLIIPNDLCKRHTESFGSMLPQCPVFAVVA